MFVHFVRNLLIKDFLNRLIRLLVKSYECKFSTRDMKGRYILLIFSAYFHFMYIKMYSDLTMDVLLNGLCISAKKELQSLYSMMRKRCHIDVTFWPVMVGD